MRMWPIWSASITRVVMLRSDFPKIPHTLLLPLLVLLFSACGTLSGERLDSDFDVPEWQSELLQDHPLVGRIWQHRSQQFISAQSLSRSLAGGEILLLGEKHDNPDHHALRLALLEQVHRQRRVSLIAMEMLTEAQQARVDALQIDAGLTSDGRALAGLRDQLEWDDGWHWEFYAPLLEFALKASDLELRSANIDRDTLSAVYRGELPPSVSAALVGALTGVQRDSLAEDIDTSHCGLLPDSQFESMVRVQQVRDHTMAQALLVDGRASRNAENASATASDGLRVLVAGNYHVRRDLGVPNYLPPGLRSETDGVITVAFLEVVEGRLDPADYQQQLSGLPAWDYIWFTPALTDEDYCERMAGGT